MLSIHDREEITDHGFLPDEVEDATKQTQPDQLLVIERQKQQIDQQKKRIDELTAELEPLKAQKGSSSTVNKPEPLKSDIIDLNSWAVDVYNNAMDSFYECEQFIDITMDSLYGCKKFINDVSDEDLEEDAKETLALLFPTKITTEPITVTWD